MNKRFISGIIVLSITVLSGYRSTAPSANAATPATTATTTNAWLNIDPDCGYDGWADAYPTIDPDYDPTLYWTEEDWAIARSLRFE